MPTWWESPAALLGYSGTLAPLFVHPADLAPVPLLWVGAAAQGAGNVLAVVGICDLGRSFGIVAAHRRIKTGGLYRSVRHPIYAAYLLAFGGFVLAHPSIYNGVVLLAWGIIQIARIHAEEHLLAADPQYTTYAQRVRHRLIPGIW
jgi:protein-S-isoprenylcysteine O-methyltransferase Ste14